MNRFAIVQAPSSLGLISSGVELLPRALLGAGLADRLQAEDFGQVDAPAPDERRDSATLLLNPYLIREYSRLLSHATVAAIEKGRFPVVLGGDCSILIGCMLGLRRLGTYGLFFIDGHADFYRPEAEPNGEVASMELAIVTGRGPEILSDIDGLKPLVRDVNTVAFGFRDKKDQQQYGSQDISITPITCCDLDCVRSVGCSTAIRQAVEILCHRDIDGFWIHCDADVLDDAIMPAVDYRVPEGLQWHELSELLSALMRSGKPVGITITIFNPRLDPDGRIAEIFSRCIADGLLNG